MYVGPMPPNVFGDDWDAEQTQQGFTWKRLRLGADRLGASVFERPARIIALSTMIEPDITE